MFLRYCFTERIETYHHKHVSATVVQKVLECIKKTYSFVFLRCVCTERSKPCIFAECKVSELKWNVAEHHKWFCNMMKDKSWLQPYIYIYIYTCTYCEYTTPRKSRPPACVTNWRGHLPGAKTPWFIPGEQQAPGMFILMHESQRLHENQHFLNLISYDPKHNSRDPKPDEIVKSWFGLIENLLNPGQLSFL